jgi:hypothetical protein
MLILGNRAYIKGTLDITDAALSRLKELGIEPPRNRFPQGGYFDSFWMTEGYEEFAHKGGDPANAGSLCLKVEV